MTGRSRRIGAVEPAGGVVSACAAARRRDGRRLVAQRRRVEGAMVYCSAAPCGARYRADVLNENIESWGDEP
jgi:hypothetical protein